MDLDTQCDLAIGVFQQFCVDPNDPSIQSLVDELNVPDWSKIIDKIHLLWKKNYEKSVQMIDAHTERQSHIQKFEHEVRKLMSKRPEFTNWQKFFNFIIDHELQTIKNELNGVIKEIKPQIEAQLPQKQPQIYELAHMIRAHSSDGKSDDDSIEICDAAFEPVYDANDQFCFTNIVATCGGPIINFINAETGEVVKQFRDEMEYNRAKEKFYQIAWSCVTGKSILIAGGLHGEIKGILPQESTCIMRFRAHDKAITCLLVHPDENTILFTASEEKSIKIWKINAKNETNSIWSHEQLTQIDSLSSIISMCIHHNHLLATSNEGNFIINLQASHEYTQLQVNKLVYDDIDLNHEKITINKLISYKNVLIANLANSSLTYTFELTKENHLKCLFSFDLGSPTHWLKSKLTLSRENNALVILKATDNGCFYKVEMDESLTKRKTKMKFIIPTDYKIKSKSSIITMHVKNQNLLDTIRVMMCVSNEQFIVNTTDNNLIVIWKKKAHK